jgi:HEAT repeat protein
VDPLIVLLQDERDVIVIEEAVTSLGKIGGTDAIECLLDLLSDKESSKGDSLEKRLIYAIGSIKNQESMSVLIDILKRGDESDINKNIAVDMLNGFNEEELPVLLKEAVEEAEECDRQALEAAKEDAEKGEKIDEASVIDEKGESEGEEKKAAVSSEMVAEAGEEEAKPDFKVWAAMALKGNKSNVSKELLYNLLEDDDPQVSKEAAISLASIGEEQALNTLVPEKPTRESMIELGVLESVANIDGPRADEILLAFLDNHNGDIRYFTLKAIGGKYRSDAIFQKVLTLLQDNLDMVKQEAVVTLGNMKHPEAVEPLVSLLFSSDAGDYLHDDIIKALHKLDNKEASNMILYGLTDCAECVIQSRAIEVLTELNLNV